MWNFNKPLEETHLRFLGFIKYADLNPAPSNGRRDYEYRGPITLQVFNDGNIVFDWMGGNTVINSTKHLIDLIATTTNQRLKDYACPCMLPGPHYSGIPGILCWEDEEAQVEGMKRETGFRVERCDQCDVFETDAIAEVILMSAFIEGYSISVLNKTV